MSRDPIQVRPGYFFKVDQTRIKCDLVMMLVCIVKKLTNKYTISLFLTRVGTIYRLEFLIVQHHFSLRDDFWYNAVHSSEKNSTDLVVAYDGYNANHKVATVIAKVLFEQLLICTAV